MVPCLSEVTTMPTPFDEDLRAFAGAACGNMEVWLTKLEDFVARNSVETARQLAAQYEIKLAVASAHGGILVDQQDQRRESLNLFEQRLQLCQQLQIATLVVIADFPAMNSNEYEHAVHRLKQAARMAADHAVRLALEFQARRSFCNNLQTAVSCVEQCDEPNVGICLDLFHYYTGPSKFEDLLRLPASRLFHVQFSDLAGTPRELATDSDRVLPGDGDFALGPIVEHLRTISYQGCVSVELFNPHIWQVPASQVAEVSITALRKVLGMTELRPLSSLSRQGL
jgi:sugar phosphate isomerase/epimerase